MMKVTRSPIPLRTVLVLVFGLSFSIATSFSEDTYEFRGRVLQPDGKSFRDALATVFLQGATTPFTTRTLAGGDGKFKFKKLREGMYSLIIAVPLWGEMRRTIEISPSFADAKGRIEKIFYLEERYARDDKYIISASQLTVSDRALREYHKAVDRLEKHEVSRAIEHLERAVELAPQFAAAWNNLGTIAYHSGDYRQAEEYFREALEQDAGAYAPLVNLGGALLSQQREEEAVPVNERAVRMRPDDALAHSQLGQCYFSLRRLEDAERHLRQAKSLDPRHFSFPQLVLAELYQQRGDDSALIHELEEFLEYHPDSDRAPEITDWLNRIRPRISSGQ
ncbi:MAG: tetratricopeptide repeat protein [Acidobacteriota bacterium]|nr:tetratricopeptide repeat protein [Acidobacteriota bacterium]